MRHVVTFFITATIRNASKLAVHCQEQLETLRLFRLPDRQPDRYYPIVVRKKPIKEMPARLTDWHYADGRVFFRCNAVD